MSNKTQFATKIGLIAATVGSAVGLGNVWRFPVLAQSNGGAAFLLIYIACVFILGIPVMMAEFSLGRGGGSDAVGSFMNITPGKKWWMAGAIAIIASYLILCYYMVVAGWTMEYLWQSITGNLYEGINASNALDSSNFTTKMKEYIVDDYNPLIFTYIMLAANFAVLLFGVKKGIERLSNILMPMLFILLIVFGFVSLSLPKADEGLKFFLNPDFSKIDGSVIINAMGQAFFSLSLGMGILITYASYYPKTTILSRTAVTVSLLDMTVAIMMGIIIFPAVTSFGLTGESLEGPSLVFSTLPEVFAQMPLTQLWSSLFFFFLMVAALTSTISIAEVSIAFMQDRFKMSRLKACIIVIAPLFLFSSLCSLSQGSLGEMKIAGLTLFDLFDTIATNILLPIASILLCIYMGWIAPKSFFKNQLSNYGTVKSRVFHIVLFIVRFIAPILITTILIAHFI
ncbi:MAG: sodium-dependent transporter [Muribaculaceae bacterium]|nr:sodium-dependent transporter [Muribaculaceae bacterium]